MKRSEITAAVRLNGGLGTYLMEMNYLKCFYDCFLESISFTVYWYEKSENSLFDKCDFIEKQEYRNKFNDEKQEYDFSIDLNWFPNIEINNLKNIENCSIQLLQYLFFWKKKKEDPSFSNFFRNDDLYEAHIYQYAIAKGKNRINIMDEGEWLGIEREYRFRLHVNAENDILTKFNLVSSQYITLQNGVNDKTSKGYSPKMWPRKYYEELCKLMKIKFPNIKLIQIGEGGKEHIINGVDECFVNSTTMDELKVILKNAWLHIDGECGMVHMRKALGGGKSVVLFGQTPMAIYAHDSDINLTAGICEIGCSKIHAAWKKKCLLSEKPRCMYELLPQTVYEKIIQYVDSDRKDIYCSNRNLKDILADEGILIDSQWWDEWLSNKNIIYYCLEKVSVSELTALILTEDGYKLGHLNDTASYKYLEGDKDAYQEYMNLNDRLNKGHEHSVEKFLENIKLYEKKFDDAYKIVVDAELRILDGVHRASWLMHKYGNDKEIQVLKIYCRVENSYPTL